MRDLFGKYGTVLDIETPQRWHGKWVPLGIGLIRFETEEAAISAYASLDKSYFQGRKLHIKPAEKKKVKPVDTSSKEYLNSTNPYFNPESPEKPHENLDENPENLQEVINGDQ